MSKTTTTTQARTFCAVAGALLVASVALLVWQVQAGEPARSRDNQFAHIMVAGWLAIFTTIALHLVLKRGSLGAGVRIALMAANAVLFAVGGYLLANAFWS